MTTTSRVIERFEEAVRKHAFKGAQMPEDHYAVEREYLIAKSKLYAALGLVYVYPEDNE